MAFTSLLKAAWPAVLVQFLSPNITLTCPSAASPRRRSSDGGTNGARRSAASGTPNTTTATIDTAAASDQPMMAPTPCRPGIFSSSREQRAVSSAATAASRISSRASAGAVRQLRRSVPGRTVGAADVVIRPSRRRLPRFVEFEPILECQRHQPTAARRAVEINHRPARLRRRRRIFRPAIHRNGTCS